MTETDDPTDEVVTTATLIAAAAPAKQGENVHSALVPWRLIHRLRADLERAGIDWESLR